MKSGTVKTFVDTALYPNESISIFSTQEVLLKIVKNVPSKCESILLQASSLKHQGYLEFKNNEQYTSHPITKKLFRSNKRNHLYMEWSVIVPISGLNMVRSLFDQLHYMMKDDVLSAKISLLETEQELNLQRLEKHPEADKYDSNPFEFYERVADILFGKV